LRKFLSPTDNKFLCILIQILVGKWRWIHRIEKLLKSVDENLNPMRRDVPCFEATLHRDSGMRRLDPYCKQTTLWQLEMRISLRPRPQRAKRKKKSRSPAR
jgi:hypothetical protein